MAVAESPTCMSRSLALFPLTRRLPAASALQQVRRPRIEDDSASTRLTDVFTVATLNMHIEFDAAKDRGNQTKHGVSLFLAAELDWDSALVWVDERIDYGEARMVALARIAETLYCVAFVDRGDARRIISLRRANRREVTHYVEHA
jgi:uncharacterized DUF497 family protein